MNITLSPLRHYKTVEQYQEFAKRFLEFKDEAEKVKLNRLLCRTDLFWLLWHGCNKHYIAKQWILDRCKEVEIECDGTIDIWAREHFKSTLITYGKNIQDILASHGEDPLPQWPREVTIGILSVTRPLAKSFLREIKQTFEDNALLKSLFPDILYQFPRTQSPKWSEDEGICVKRKSVFKEQTVEAWGLIDGQPTGKHFFKLNYDDIVTQDSVTTPEMIQKTTAAFGLSDNIGTRGGITCIVGTFYHSNDTLNHIIDTGVYKLRKYPATIEGKWPVDSDDETILLTKAELELKAIKQGPYIFSCFEGNTRILTENWGEKNIKDVKVGDCVVGYKFGDGKKARLVRTKVIALNNRKADAVKFTFESGREIICTPDHKFWSGRVERGYTQLGFHKSHLKSACTIYDPRKCDVSNLDPKAVGYLTGIFDGEGSISGKTVHISQCYKTNPKICDKIEETFSKLGLKWSVHIPPSRPNHRDYYLVNGREEKIKFSRLMKDCGKESKVIQSIYDSGTRNIGKNSKDKLLSIEEVGEIEVYNIQTETGNYIANGYAVKNCQILLNPTASSLQNFKFEWLKYYGGWDKYRMTGNFYIICDPANSKKKTSDYTVFIVVAACSDGNIYVVDMVRDRLNLAERTNTLFSLVKIHRPILVGYEQYGMQSDIEHIREKMEQLNYRFNIVELGGKTAKNDRISKIIPDFQNAKIWLPFRIEKKNYEGKSENLVDIFVKEEYLVFPTPKHDDMLDCLARIKDLDLCITYPLEPEQEDDNHDETLNDTTRNKATGY